MHQWKPPDPDVGDPPGKLGHAVNLVLGLLKWGGLVGAVGAMIAAGAMMAIGRRNRNNAAVEGAMGIPWVFGGIAVILGAASLVGWLTQ